MNRAGVGSNQQELWLELKRSTVGTESAGIKGADAITVVVTASVAANVSSTSYIIIELVLPFIVIIIIAISSSSSSGNRTALTSMFNTELQSVM